MKKNLLSLLFALLLLPFAVMGQCGTDVLNASDVDGNSYTSLKIGPHCWTQFNLKTKAEGSFIYKSDMYPDTTANLGIYGRLYNWYTAMNVQPGQTPVVGEHNFVQGICPEGWHLPNDVEVAQLMTNTAPTLHDVQYWLVPGTNTTTYTMRPGGFYNASKNYGENLCGDSYMWTAQSLDETKPTIVWSDCHCDYIMVKQATATDGMSVRCVYKIYEGTVTTDSAREITSDAATLYGTVVFNGYDESYERGFVYGTNTATLDNWVVESSVASANGPYSKAIDGLTPLTKYYYQAYMVNDFDTVWGELKTFTTLALPMNVTTDSASAITTHTAQLYGKVTSMGGSSAVRTGFRYGLSADALTNQVDKQVTDTGSYDIQVTALSLNTTYYYQAYVCKDNDTVVGSVESFKTKLAPVIATSIKNGSITATSVGLQATLINLNGATISKIGLYFGKKSIATFTDTINAGVLIYKNDLEPSTEYKVQAFMISTWGDTVKGELKTFMTLALPMNVTTDSASAITTHTAQLYGKVTSMGGSSAVRAGFRYGLSADALTNQVDKQVADTGSYDIQVTALSLNTTYYYQAYVCKDNDTVVGSVESFKTKLAPVIATSIKNGSITATSVGLQATLINLNGATISKIGLYFGKKSIATFTDTINAGVLIYKNDLEPSTEYKVQAFMISTWGDTVKGELKTFTTLELLMNVTTGSANTITNNSAKLYGNETDMGGMTTLNAGFKYGTSASALTSIVTKSGAVTAAGSYNCDLTGLTGNTIYYYKAFAANGTDTVYGEVLNFTTAHPSCSGTPTVTDYDGNTYNTVQIGTQCWMKENLKTTRYANGTAIAKGSSTSTETAYRYNPGNDERNVSTYGYLYNWPAVMGNSSSGSSNPSGVQGICPTGWHVPSDAEWTQLTNYVSSQSSYQCNGSSSNIAKALASKTGWNSDAKECAVGNVPEGNNATGFAAVPAGLYDGSYGNFGGSANFWSATQHRSGNAYGRYLNCYNANVYRSSHNKYYGFSVRCLRN